MQYFSKTQRILSLCRGKRVLHIGCVGFADLQTEDRVALAKASLHYALTNSASTIGIDYSRDAIDYFRSNHIFDNVLHGNAESIFSLGLAKEFDVVVAGDIIEHLSNPGLMLDGIKSICKTDTLIVLTTPHALGLLTFLRHLTNRFVEGNEHVFTMNSQNVHNLATRHGFEVLDVDTCYQDFATKSVMFRIGRRFFELFPKLGGTLFVVLRMNDFHKRSTDVSPRSV